MGKGEKGSVISPKALQDARDQHRTGRLVEAERLYIRILDEAPDNAEALHLLGVLSGQKGDAEKAVDLLRRAIRCDDGQSAYYLNLGTSLMSLDHWAEAADAYKAVIRLAPGDAEAHYFLGCGLEKLDAPDDALEAYRQAIALDPEYADAHYNLGTLLLALNRPEEARAALLGALEIDPDFADALNNLGTALRDLGKPEEAVTAYRRGLEIDPGHAVARGNLGNVYLELGEFHEAEACYLQALKIEPKFTQVYEYLAGIETFTAPNELSKAMETLAADPSLTDGQTMHLSFALAKTYDDLGEYDQAFACLDRGNRIKRRSFDYDVADDEAYFERLEAALVRAGRVLEQPHRFALVIFVALAGFGSLSAVAQALFLLG